MLLLFGEITGIVVTYVEAGYNSTLSSEERYLLDENLLQDGIDFAIRFCIIGVLTIISTYIASVLFGFSTVRQVRALEINYKKNLK